jgi:hypothetical protein
MFAIIWMDPWYTRHKMPCIALTPFKHENGRVNNNTLLVIAQIQLGLATPATTATRTKPKIGRQAFGASGSKLETQAT